MRVGVAHSSRRFFTYFRTSTQPRPPPLQPGYPSHPIFVASALLHGAAFTAKRSRGDIQTVWRHREPLGHLLMKSGPLVPLPSSHCFGVLNLFESMTAAFYNRPWMN